MSCDIMKIQSNAPYAVRKETIISAPIETVWQLLTDFNRWPQWQEAVKTARIQGDLKPGSVFRWNSGGMNLVSTLEIVEPMQTIGWTGKGLGTQAVHLWYLEQTPAGTKVVTEESLSGWLPRVLKVFMPRFLDSSLTKTLEDLQKAVKSR
jgi:uncharacterized protein YndB with AHSA1/START domain